MPLKTRLGTLVIALLAFVLAFPFADRVLRALLTTSQAMNNIYEQQYQMGRFVQEYYEGESLALNDIGAVTYLADTRLLDLWGLASKEVAKAKLDQAYGPGVIAGLADQHGVRIAIVYDLFFDETGGLPASWDKVGEWRIRNNRVCASDVVAFYAVEPDAKAKLIQNLRDFQAELPPDVEQSGEYLGSEGGS